MPRHLTRRIVKIRTAPLKMYANLLADDEIPTSHYRIRLQQHLFRLAQSLRSMSLANLAVGLVIARAVGVFGLRLR